MKNGKTLLRPLAMLVAFSFLASCMTTRNSVFAKVDEGVEARDYVGVANALNGTTAGNYYRDKDQVLRYLDAGMLYHIGNKPEESRKCFEEAEKLIEENYTKSISDAATSFLLNDYSLVYFGQPYEDIYLNVFKAIDYIRMNKFDDAYVEVRRVGTKLNLLEDKYGKLAESMNSSKEAKGSVKAVKPEFQNSALAHYLSLLLYRASGQRDDAALDLKKLKQAFTDQPKLYDFPCPNLDSMLVRSDKAKLDVIGFAGKSPAKKANTLRLNTGNGVVLLSLSKEDDKGKLYFTNLDAFSFPGVDAGYNFKCQLPEMIIRPTSVDHITVVVDGSPVGNLALLERLDTVAYETFKLTEGPTFAKTIIRTVTKGIIAAKAKEKTKDAAGSAGLGGQIFAFAGGLAADAAVEASEQADLRSARYFPGQARVGEFEIPVGEHEVAVEYYAGNGQLLYREAFPRKNYTNGGLNLLASYDLQ